MNPEEIAQNQERLNDEKDEQMAENGQPTTEDEKLISFKSANLLN